MFSSAVNAVYVQLAARAAHTFDHFVIIIHRCEFHVDMEHIVPRFARDRRRLQLGHVDRRILHRPQHLQQRSLPVVGHQAQRRLIGLFVDRLVVGAQNHKAGAVVLDRMDVGSQNFESEQPGRQFAGDRGGVARAPFGDPAGAANEREISKSLVFF